MIRFRKPKPTLVQCSNGHRKLVSNVDLPISMWVDCPFCDKYMVPPTAVPFDWERDKTGLAT